MRFDAFGWLQMRSDEPAPGPGTVPGPNVTSEYIDPENHGRTDGRTDGRTEIVYAAPTSRAKISPRRLPARKNRRPDSLREKKITFLLIFVFGKQFFAFFAQFSRS